MDEPVEDGPKNANGTYLGNVTVRTAVEKSINTLSLIHISGTEAVRGTGNRIPYDRVIVPFALCAKWGRTALRDT